MKQELFDLLTVIKLNFNPSKKETKADVSWEKTQFAIAAHIDSLRVALGPSTFDSGRAT